VIRNRALRHSIILKKGIFLAYQNLIPTVHILINMMVFTKITILTLFTSCALFVSKYISNFLKKNKREAGIYLLFYAFKKANRI
jgi:hypothetical protein